MLNSFKNKMVLIFVVALVVSLFISGSIYADGDVPGELYIYEEAPGLGAVEDSILPSASLSVPETEVLPTQVDLSDDIYFPPIRSQYGGSCVAWSTVYYQFTYEAAKLNNWNAKTNDEYVFSPRYVWTHLNGGINTGVSAESCYEFLSKQGTLRWLDYPHNTVSMSWYQGSTYAETVANLREALNTRVSGYNFYKFIDSSQVVTGEPTITSPSDENIKHMKKMLNQGHPLTIYTYVNSFYTAFLPNGDRICLYQRGNNGYHAMTVVGYDDTISYDLNGDDVIQEYEKGAFLVANSWGEGYGNDGYIWVLYDALNRYSNVSSLNFTNRQPIFENYIYRTITVQNYSPDLVAEVTLNYKYRNDLNLEIARKATEGNSVYTETYLDNIGGALNVNGETTYASSVFVVDYSSVYYIGENDYLLKVIDSNANNSSVTNIEKVRWVYGNGTLLCELNNQGTVDGASKELESFYQITDITINEGNLELYSYETDGITLTTTILPTNAEITILNWSSSNPNAVSVDNNGKITYVGVGSAIITASTTDGSGLSANITVTTLDDYADVSSRAKQIALDSTTSGEIETASDCDYFKFVAPASGTYIFNTEGTMDSLLYLYASNGEQLDYSDDYNYSDYCSAVSYDMTQGSTYYIKVAAYTGDVGEYNLRLRDFVCSDMFSYVGQSGRHITFEGRFAAIFDTFELVINNVVYTLEVPSDLSSIDTTINGIRFTVDFSGSDSDYTYWDVDVYIPTTQNGVSGDVTGELIKDDFSVSINLSDYEI